MDGFFTKVKVTEMDLLKGGLCVRNRLMRMFFNLVQYLHFLTLLGSLVIECERLKKATIETSLQVLVYFRVLKNENQHWFDKLLAAF